MLITILYSLGLASGAFTAVASRDTAAPAVAPRLLQWYFPVSIGTTLLISGTVHAFKGDIAAIRLTWPAGNPFQKEVGYWDRAAGTVAVFSFWRHGEFWLAAVILNIIFWTWAGLLHLYELVHNQNRSADNALPGIMNLVGAATLLVLFPLAK
jgi:hypothetical protein